MMRIRFVGCIMILAILLSFTDQGVAKLQSTCGSTNCVYLPLAAISMPLHIVETNMVRNRGGTVRILGDVMATTTSSLFDVLIEARPYGHSGQLLGTYTETTILTATLPYELNPFDIYIDIFSDDVDYYEVSIIGWNPNGDQNFKPLTVVYSQTQYIGDWAYVYAEVRNDEPYSMSNVQGVAWSLNQVNVISSQLLTDSLAPGETISFTTSLYYAYLPTKVIAQGQTLPLSGKFPIVNGKPLKLAWLDPFWTWGILDPGRSWVLPFLKG